MSWGAEQQIRDQEQALLDDPYHAAFNELEPEAFRKFGCEGIGWDELSKDLAEDIEKYIDDQIPSSIPRAE